MRSGRYYLGIDLGGTNIKSGIVSQSGELVFSTVVPTPAQAGRAAVLRQLKTAAHRCLEQAQQAGIILSGLGVATIGWVNPATGDVIHASENIPGWSGTPLGQELQAAASLPVVVENDANALAIAEKHFGAARDAEDFICITLGTGIGSGCYIGGRLHRGAHYLANELGHMQIKEDGLPCTCGNRGCLEVYANAAALVRYAAAGGFASAKEVIAAANAANPVARSAIQTYARHLAAGCVSAVNLLDPQALIFAGGITQNNPILLSDLKEEVARRLLVPERRQLQLRFSELGYFGGVIGAAAAALTRTL
jgi:glucokinase